FYSFVTLFFFFFFFFFFQAEDGIRDGHVTGVQTCALPICVRPRDPAVLTVCPDRPPHPSRHRRRRFTTAMTSRAMSSARPASEPAQASAGMPPGRLFG